MFDTQQPKLIQQSYPNYMIRFNLKEANGPEGEPGWEYDEVEVPNLAYGTVVSAIIHHRYSPDAEMANLNNYTVDPEGEENEWQEYQNWRNIAKTYTKNTLGIGL